MGKGTTLGGGFFDRRLQVNISQFETGGLVPSKSHIKKIVDILDLYEETFNKEPCQFYQAKKKEPKKQIKER